MEPTYALILIAMFVFAIALIVSMFLPNKRVDAHYKRLDRFIARLKEEDR